MLTVEELKSLEVGDWVWLIIEPNSAEMHIKSQLISNTYHRKVSIMKGYDAEKCFFAFDVMSGQVTCLCFEDYGIKWFAYRNKEEAEGVTIVLPCKVGAPVYTIGFNSFCECVIKEVKCTGFKIMRNNEITIETNFQFDDPYKLGKFVSIKQAEKRLKELQNNS